MDDYDVNNNTIDAIIVFSSNISKKDMLKLKYLEIVNNDAFCDTLENNSSIKVFENGSNEFNNIVKEYDAQKTANK